ncbi:Transmembrane protein 51, partial [Phalacrocorax carbo]
LLLLLSICLNIRDKKRQSEDIARVQHQVSAEPSHQEDSQEEDEDVSSQYYVPSYEEVMNVGYSEPRDLDRSNRPLKVRRIKSEKLHLKDIRLNLPQGNSTTPITIEPLTPPPKYEDIQEKVPESQQM